MTQYKLLLAKKIPLQISTLSGAIPIENTMSTNLSPNSEPTATSERVIHPVTQGALHEMALKSAQDIGFDLHENADETFDLLWWFGPDKPRLGLALFNEIRLETAITILDNADPDAWEHLDKLMAKLGPLDPWACKPAESSKAGSPAMQKLRAEYLAAQKLQAELKPDKPSNEWTLDEQAIFRTSGDAKRAAECALQRQHNIEHNLVITNIFLTLSYDELLEEDNDDRSLCTHEPEIFEVAIADFNERYHVPNPPDINRCYINGVEAVELYDSQGRGVASYVLEINTTDFPGRVELTFNEPED